MFSAKFEFGRHVVGVRLSHPHVLLLLCIFVVDLLAGSSSSSRSRPCAKEAEAGGHVRSRESRLHHELLELLKGIERLSCGCCHPRLGRLRSHLLHLMQLHQTIGHPRHWRRSLQGKERF